MVSCCGLLVGDSSVALLFPVHYWLLLLCRFLFSLVFPRFLFWSQPFCFGWCFDSVRPPFVFFALVFVLVVLVVVFFSPHLLFGGGVCLRGFIDVFGSVFFVAYGPL